MRRHPNFLAAGYAMRAIRWFMERGGTIAQREFSAEYNASRAFPGREPEMSKPSFALKREMSRFLVGEKHGPWPTTIAKLCSECGGRGYRVPLLGDNAIPSRPVGLACPTCRGNAVVVKEMNELERAASAREQAADAAWRVIRREHAERITLTWVGPSVDELLASLTPAQLHAGYETMEWSMQQRQHSHDAEHFARWALWCKKGKRT